MDQYHDPGFVTLRRLCQRFSKAAEFIKSSSIEDDISELPKTAFAWSEKQMFPVHSRTQAVISALYLKQAAVPREVQEAVKIALEAYEVPPEIFVESMIKEAAWTDEECLFPETQSYPIRTSEEVKTAEFKVLGQVTKLSFENRNRIFGKLFKRAQSLGVTLSPQSYKYAGQTMTDPQILRDNLRARASATKDSQVKEGFLKLAEAVIQDRKALRDPARQTKLAATISELDKKGGLIPHYDRRLAPPQFVVYNTEKVAGDEGVDLGGKYYPIASLAQLPITFFSDALGKDVVREIAPGGQIDPQALQQVVETLPTDLKKILAQGLHNAGI